MPTTCGSRTTGATGTGPALVAAVHPHAGPAAGRRGARVRRQPWGARSCRCAPARAPAARRPTRRSTASGRLPTRPDLRRVPRLWRPHRVRRQLQGVVRPRALQRQDLLPDPDAHAQRQPRHLRDHHLAGARQPLRALPERADRPHRDGHAVGGARAARRSIMPVASPPATSRRSARPSPTGRRTCSRSTSRCRPSPRRT